MPEITIVADKLPTVTKTFETYEEQKLYVQAETIATAHILHEFYKAITPEDRKKMREAVYHARVAFKNKCEHKPEEKVLA